MAIVPSSSKLDGVQEIKILIPITEENNKEEKELSDLHYEYRFRSFLFYSFTLMFITLIIITCLDICAIIQVYSWIKKIGDNSTVITEMENSAQLSSIITELTVFVCILYIVKFRGLIKIFRETRWWRFIILLLMFIASTYIFGHILLPSPTVQIFVDKTFQNDNLLVIARNPLLSTIEDSYSEVPNSIIYLQFVSIICSIQNIIILMILIRYKPKNFDIFKYNTRKNSPSSLHDSDQKPMKQELVVTQSDHLLQVIV